MTVENIFTTKELELIYSGNYKPGCAELDAKVKLAFKHLAAYAAGAAAEREACAKLCDEMEANTALSDLEKYRTRFISDAIRARSQK